MPAKVFIARRIISDGPELLRKNGCEVVVNDVDRPATRTELEEGLEGSSAILTCLTERIDADLLRRYQPTLKVVANYAAGYNNIDLTAAREMGIAVTNTPGVLTAATADIAMTLLLSLARRVREGENLVRSGRWAGWGPLQLLGFDLNGKTMGIFGAGAIGTATAVRAQAFGMKIIYCSRSQSHLLESAIPGAKRCQWEELLSQSDVLSLHAPYSTEVHHLVDAEAFRRMKREALFINTARGPIHDESALVDALQTGIIAGAGLDVYEEEPKVHPSLFELSNVVLLPHLGSATTRTRREMSRMAAENILAVLQGKQPPNQVS